MAPFSSPNTLLQWADSDIKKLDAIISDVIDNAKAVRVTDTDPETGNKIHKFVFDRKLPSDATRLATEIIVHCRHALDQAVCAAWEIASLGEVPRDLYFPFATKVEDLEGRLRTYPLKELGVAVGNAIRDMKPYPAPQGTHDGNPALIALNDAAKRKHRIVPRLSVRVIQYELRNSVFIKPITPIGWFEWNMEKGELIFGITAPDGYMSVNLALATEVTLSGAGQLDGLPAVEAMERILKNCKLAVGKIEKAATK